MNELARTGKKRTILISISILLISIHTIYYYNHKLDEIVIKKLIQQVIRFILTISLLIMIYKGKKWAKNIAGVLFTIAALVALIALIKIDSRSFIAKSHLLVMVFIYSIAAYHFALSKSFKAFFEYQNRIDPNGNQS